MSYLSVVDIFCLVLTLYRSLNSSLHVLIAVDRVSFTASHLEAYESDGGLEVLLTLQRSTDVFHNVSVRVRTRDLVTEDSAQGLTYSSFLKV